MSTAIAEPLSEHRRRLTALLFEVATKENAIETNCLLLKNLGNKIEQDPSCLKDH